MQALANLSVRLVAPLAVGLLAACGGHPTSYSSLGELPIEDTYSCAIQEINEMGYTMANADRDAGLIQAQQESSSTFGELLSGERSFRVLTVSVFEDTDTEETRMRVTASKNKESILSGVFGGGQTTGGEPDDETEEDAEELVRSCGGTVTTPDGEEGQGESESEDSI